VAENKTAKQRIIEMLQRLPDDIDYDRAIESIYVLQKVEVALDQVRRGEVYDDDEVMKELLDDHEEVQAQMGAGSEG
jgi:hypothetical protein